MLSEESDGLRTAIECIYPHYSDCTTLRSYLQAKVPSSVTAFQDLTTPGSISSGLRIIAVTPFWFPSLPAESHFVFRNLRL